MMRDMRYENSMLFDQRFLSDAVHINEVLGIQHNSIAAY